MNTESGTSGTADDMDLFESEATGQPVPKPTTIPDKYVGKSVEEIIQMHQNAEKRISVQGAELGQVRSMAAQLLEFKKPTTETKVVERTPVTVEALLNDPEKALRSAVDSSDLVQRVQRAEERNDRLEKLITQNDFVAKHSTYADDMNDPKFIEWTQKNDVRKALGQAAAQDNFVAAKSLWELWEEHQELVGAQTSKSDSPKSTAKKVPNTVKQAPTESRGEPKYSWAKLMELRLKMQDGDPAAVARWNQPEFQAKLIKAYEDKRVV